MFGPYVAEIAAMDEDRPVRADGPCHCIPVAILCGANICRLHAQLRQENLLAHPDRAVAHIGMMGKVEQRTLFSRDKWRQDLIDLVLQAGYDLATGFQ